MPDMRLALQLTAVFGAGGAFAILVIWFFVSDLSRLWRAWGLLARLPFLLTRRWKRNAAGARIEAHVNSAISQLSREAPSAFPCTFRLEWISSAEQHALLRDGTVVVRVRDQPDQARALAASTMLFLQRGVLPDARPFIERRVVNAMDLVLACRMLENSPFLATLNALSEDYLEPSLEDPRTAAFYETADTTDRAGLLTRIVLREFSGLPERLAGLHPSAAIRAETANFLLFVGRVAARTSEVPLSYFGRYLKCTVALIARTDVYESAGLALYRRNFKRDIDSGIHVIYLLARGIRNLGIARAIAKWASDEGLVSGSIPDRYTQPDERGNPVPAECIVCFSARVGRAVQVSPLEEALIALSQVIPETLTGDLEIVSIARDPGAVTKVLVRSDRYADPAAICTGERKARVRAIQAALRTEEPIDFVAWAPDQKSNVIAALVPLRAEDVASAWMAPDGLSAMVYVRSPDAAHRAVGSDGANLKVAQSLLSLHIDLETRDSPLSPEEELLQVLHCRIPEIAEGKIQVVRMARRIGRASKVAVQSDVVAHPLRACVGPGGTTVQAISNDLGGEHVRFLTWHPDNIGELVAAALHPLPRRDVISVDVDQSQQTVTVVVRQGKPVGLAIGKEGDNVRLAERICGLRIVIKEQV